MRYVLILLALSIFNAFPVASVDANDAIIDAGQFDSLQAAANAIPQSGGVLRIPPGNYEINEPIRIKTGDTQIIGFGTATNIVNKNEEGLPALLIENPAYAGQSTPSKIGCGASALKICG
ncbi:MAG: hypothetical protein R3C05_11180 [Pirellulaceae bacterium]